MLNETFTVIFNFMDNYDLLITVCSCCSSFLCVCFLTRKQATFRIMQHLRRAEKRKKTYFIAVELCKRGSRPQPLFLRLLNETLPLLFHFPIFCLLTNLGFLSKHFIVRQLFSKGLRKHCDKISWFPLIKNTKLLSHIAWKLLKMSHLNFWILAFSTNFCPITTDLPGNTVWPQASYFQKLAKMDHFGHF